MPKQTVSVDYAFDVACYGSRDIEVEIPEGASQRETHDIVRAKLQELDKADELFDGWKPDYDTATNHRVLEATIGEETVVGEFQLNPEPQEK